MARFGKDTRHKAVIVLAPAVVTASQTEIPASGQAGIDIAGFDAVEFIFATGVVTDGTYVVKVKECDLSTGTYTEAEDVDVLHMAASDGTAKKNKTDGLPIATADDGKVFKFSYVGKKRYVKLAITSSGQTSGGLMTALCVLGDAQSGIADMPM